MLNVKSKLLMLSVIMLNNIMLSVVMLSAVAPCGPLFLVANQTSLERKTKSKHSNLFCRFVSYEGKKFSIIGPSSKLSR